MDGSRLVGGIWCTQVLAVLSDYIDGKLPSDELARVEAHLGSCPNCEYFGTEIAAMLALLAKLPHSITEEIAARLKESFG